MNKKLKEPILFGVMLIIMALTFPIWLILLYVGQGETEID